MELYTSPRSMKTCNTHTPTTSRASRQASPSTLGTFTLGGQIIKHPGLTRRPENPSRPLASSVSRAPRRPNTVSSSAKFGLRCPLFQVESAWPGGRSVWFVGHLALHTGTVSTISYCLLMFVKILGQRLALGGAGGSFFQECTYFKF